MRENFAFVTAHENVVLLPAALLISNTPDLNLKKRNEQKRVSSSNPGKEKLVVQKRNEQNALKKLLLSQTNIGYVNY